MTNYIPADKLVAEIERLEGLLPKDQGVSMSLDWARNTITALRQYYHLSSAGATRCGFGERD